VAQIGKELFQIAILIGNHLTQKTVEVPKGLGFSAPQLGLVLFLVL
jgi:hypothetical protein